MKNCLGCQYSITYGTQKNKMNRIPMVSFKDTINTGVNFGLVREKREMKKLSNEYNGMTLSEGTLKTDDLIETFMSFLNGVKVECNVIAQVEDIEKEIETAHSEKSGIDEATGLLYAVESITDLLDGIAPAFAPFSTHTGDGALFGFWSVLSEKAIEAIERGAKVINEDDLQKDFWGSTYHVILSPFNSVIVNAEHDQAAIDEAIDWSEDNAPGLLLSPVDVVDIIMEHGAERVNMDYTCGGSHSRYIAEMGATVFDITQ